MRLLRRCLKAMRSLVTAPLVEHGAAGEDLNEDLVAEAMLHGRSCCG